MIQYSLVGYGAVPCGVMQRNTEQYGRISIVWTGTIRGNMVEYNTVRYNSVQCSNILYDMIRCSKVQHGMLGYDIEQYDTIW